MFYKVVCLSQVEILCDPLVAAPRQLWVIRDMVLARACVCARKAASRSHSRRRSSGDDDAAAALLLVLLDLDDDNNHDDDDHNHASDDPPTGVLPPHDALEFSCSLVEPR